MSVDRLDHVCVAVHDLETARRTWEPVLGKAAPDESYVDEREGIWVHRYWIGEVGLELVAPTREDSEVARFLARRGEGLLLLALHVPSARQAAQELGKEGYSVVGNLRPFRDGEYTFLHPRSMNGVLVELIDDGA